MKDDTTLWVEKLKPLAHMKPLSKGEHVFMAATPADQFFYVISGEVRIYKLDATGKEIEVRRAGKGDIFGEVLVFAGGNYPVSAQAVTAGSLWCYNKQEVFEATQNDNALAHFFIQTLAKRCLFLNQAMDNVALQDLPVRLARYLLNFIEDKQVVIQHDNVELQLPFPKKDLASQLGTIPETLSRIFNKLQRAGLLEVRGKQIHILSYRSLKEFACLS